MRARFSLPTGFIRLNENYTFEWNVFQHHRSLSDGLTFFHCNWQADWFHGDHNPQLRLELDVLNIVVLDLSIYNIHHVEDPDEAEQETA